MSKIERFNEFVNNDELLIKKLIHEGECTPFSDLEMIAERESYKKVIQLGKKVIPYLLKRNSPIWDRALNILTGAGLNPLEYNTNERMEYWQNWAKENGYKN